MTSLVEQLESYLGQMRTEHADRITALEAEVERLAGAWKLQHKEKMKERAEAKLWFERAQGWRAEFTALEAMCETLAGFVRHEGHCGLIGGYGVCTCGLSQALTQYRAMKERNDG